MTGENGSPATPDWRPDPRPCALEVVVARWTETLDHLALGEHIELGEN